MSVCIGNVQWVYVLVIFIEKNATQKNVILIFVLHNKHPEGEEEEEDEEECEEEEEESDTNDDPDTDMMDERDSNDDASTCKFIFHLFL